MNRCVLILALAISGCAAKVENNNSLGMDSINGVTAKDLEGKKYPIFIGKSYVGIREQLKDNEIVTLKDVILERFKYGGGYFKAHYIDSSGNQIFSDYYGLSDVGILDSRIMNIDTSISTSKINPARGVILHGKKNSAARTDITYMYQSISNGDEVKAYPVQFAFDEVKPLSHGISFSCKNGTMYGVATYLESFIALNESAKVDFSFPGNRKESVGATSISYDSVLFKVSKPLEKFLLNSEAGEVWITPEANGPVRLSWLVNGMNEAYLRVKKGCA